MNMIFKMQRSNHQRKQKTLLDDLGFLLIY